MAVKVLRVRLAGRVLGAMERTLMSEGERAAYADHIQIEQAHDCGYLDAALEDGWAVIGQGQMETDQGLFHYFVLRQDKDASSSSMEKVAQLVDACNQAQLETLSVMLDATVNDDAIDAARAAEDTLHKDLATAVIGAHRQGYRMSKCSTSPITTNDIQF